MKIKSTSIELLEEFFESLNSKGLTLPEFENEEEIIIFSDYSGERGKDDNYYSYSFFVIGKQSVPEITNKIIKLRNSETEWKNDSFIEYKKMKDKVRRRILPKFLRIFDQYEGLVLTVLIDKKSTNYFMKVSPNEIDLISKLGLGEWKEKIIVKSLNILSILSFLVKRFLNSKITLSWYSDRDDIFGAQQSKEKNTLDMLSRLFSAFDVEIKEDEFNFSSDNHSLINSDFLSLPDLSAGAVLEYYQVGYNDAEIREWTKQIIGWMQLNSTNLKKLMIICNEEKGNKYLTALKNYG